MNIPVLCTVCNFALYPRDIETIFCSESFVQFAKLLAFHRDVEEEYSVVTAIISTVHNNEKVIRCDFFLVHNNELHMMMMTERYPLIIHANYFARLPCPCVSSQTEFFSKSFIKLNFDAMKLGLVTVTVIV